MNTDALTNLLADLVSIPSMNPMGRGSTGSEYTEAALAGYVADYLRRLQVDVELDEVFVGRPNVLGVVDVGAPETLLLEGHLDTVQADHMEIRPFDPVIEDGRLYGRGSCDTKGSLAAFLYALCSLLAEGKKPKYNLLFAAVVDEEYKFAGAGHLVSSGLQATFGIVGEPTRLKLVRAHKGVTRWRMLTEGRASHSAYPEQGENAIYLMARILERLEDHAEDLRHRPPHPLLGSPSLSVGVIEGGQAVNIVPDRCWIEIDRRTLPGETRECVLEPIRRILSEVQGWTMEPPHLAVAGMEVPEDSPVVRLLASAIRQELGRVEIESARYATDAGVYNAAGIPTIVFGPGDIALAHTAVESIDLQELEKAAIIIRRFLSL